VGMRTGGRTGLYWEKKWCGMEGKRARGVNSFSGKSQVRWISDGIQPSTCSRRSHYCTTADCTGGDVAGSLGIIHLSGLKQSTGDSVINSLRWQIKSYERRIKREEVFGRVKLSLYAMIIKQEELQSGTAWLNPWVGRINSGWCAPA
jgi:hypothetical protein